MLARMIAGLIMTAVLAAGAFAAMETLRLMDGAASVMRAATVPGYR